MHKVTQAAGCTSSSQRLQGDGIRQQHGRVTKELSGMTTLLAIAVGAGSYISYIPTVRSGPEIVIVLLDGQ